MTQDALFDVEELARQAVAATPWDGPCPLTYTTDYYTPAELDDAFDRWRAQYGSFGCLVLSHMWHPGFADKPLILEQHQLHRYSADASCHPSSNGVDTPGRDEALHDHNANPLPDQYMHQANCPPCRWHHINPNETAVVHAWHDHAMPGWRDLPVLPDKLGFRHDDNKQRAQRRLEWIHTNYPSEWIFDGAPILTRRTGGTRAVSGRSPLGGYDIADPGPGNMSSTA